MDTSRVLFHCSSGKRGEGTNCEKVVLSTNSGLNVYFAIVAKNIFIILQLVNCLQIQICFQQLKLETTGDFKECKIDSKMIFKRSAAND